MKSEAGTLALLALAISLIADLPAQGAPTQTKINKCPYVITAPGSYLVQKNLSCALTAITISASSVDLDLGSHTISGNGFGDGVYVQGQANVTIHDGAVQGFVFGVELQRTIDSKVTNVTASQNRDSGIAGRGGTSGLTVMACTAYQNGHNGILLDSDSRANTVTGSTANLNGSNGSYGSNGIYVTFGAFANTITNNTANQNGFWGIGIDGGGGNTVTGNTADQNSDRGITMYTSGNLVERNTCDRNGGGGIDVAGDSHNNTVMSNSATANGNRGIGLFDQPYANTIQNNTVNGSYIGIWLAGGAKGNTIQDNDATLNLLGFRVDFGATGNVFQGNTAVDSRDWDAEDDNPDCDSNIWSDNQFNTANQPCVAGLPPPPPPP